MTKSQGALVLVLLAICAATFAFTLLRPVQEWDYVLEDIPDSRFSHAMSEMGRFGWEVVFARRAENGPPGETTHPTFDYEIIFRRHKSLWGQPSVNPQPGYGR